MNIGKDLTLVKLLKYLWYAWVIGCLICSIPIWLKMPEAIFSGEISRLYAESWNDLKHNTVQDIKRYQEEKKKYDNRK